MTQPRAALRPERSRGYFPAPVGPGRASALAVTILVHHRAVVNVDPTVDEPPASSGEIEPADGQTEGGRGQVVGQADRTGESYHDALPTPTTSLTADGRRLDSKSAVLAWWADVLQTSRPRKPLVSQAGSLTAPPEEAHRCLRPPPTGVCTRSRNVSDIVNCVLTVVRVSARW